MAFDGNGTYTVPSGSQAVSGAVIDSAKYNALLADLEAALTKGLLRDGQSAALADIPMGGFTFTNLGGNLFFAAGTKIPFAQAAAPTGWTQDTSDNADNRMLRVVKTTGNGVGGSHSPVLNNVVPSHTHGFSTGTVSADHSHGDYGHSHYYTAPSLRANNAAGSIPDYITTAGANTNTGYASLTGHTANHTHSGGTDNGSSQTNWTPRYIDLIICSKN